MSRASITVIAVAAIAGLVVASPLFAQQNIGDQPESAAPARRVPAKPGATAASKAVAQAVPAATPAARLPNGASAITETYGDWTVNCGIDNGGKACIFSQAQGNKDTGQRSFAIELRTPREGRTEGTILVPFGLKLEAGALLKLDDRDLGQGLRFSTCVPQGCLVPISFPIVANDAIRKAQKLTVASLNLGSGEAVTFAISLNGFGAALDRIIQLGG